MTIFHTGLIRFGYRDYDLTIGRFTALDPARDMRGDGDLWDYCVDDPINSVDPLGLAGETLGGARNVGKGLGIAALGDVAGALPGDAGIMAQWTMRGYGYGTALAPIAGPVSGAVGAIIGAVIGYSQTNTSKEWAEHMENGGADIYEEYRD